MIKDIDRDVVLFCSKAAAEDLGYEGDYTDLWDNPSKFDYPTYYKLYAEDDWRIYRSGKPQFNMAERFEPKQGEDTNDKKQGDIILTNKWPMPFGPVKIGKWTFGELRLIGIQTGNLSKLVRDYNENPAVGAQLQAERAASLSAADQAHKEAGELIKRMSQ